MVRGSGSAARGSERPFPDTAAGASPEVLASLFMFLVPLVVVLGPYVEAGRLIYRIVKRKRLAEIHPYIPTTFFASFASHLLAPDFAGRGNDAFMVMAIPVWYVIFGVPAGFVATAVWQLWLNWGRMKTGAAKTDAGAENLLEAGPQNRAPFPLVACLVLFVLTAPSVYFAYQHGHDPMYESENCGVIRLVDTLMLR